MQDTFYQATDRRGGQRRGLVRGDRRDNTSNTLAPADYGERRAGPRRVLADRRQQVPRTLSSQEILRLGALTLQTERSDNLEALITEQRAVYQDTPKDQLILALLDRDRQLAQMGRQIADGRTAGRMLREFVRGLLATADMRTLRRVGDATKGGQIEGILEALGAEPADLRQLGRHGSTLGELEDQEARAGALADGRRKL